MVSTRLVYQPALQSIIVYFSFPSFPVEKEDFISFDELCLDFKSVCLLAVFNTIGPKATVNLKQTKTQ